MKPRYYAAIAAYCSLIFWLSNQPHPPQPEIGFPHMDKVAHIILFGGLAGLVSLGLHRSGKRYTPSIYHIAPVLVVLGYGIFDECHQYFVPPRTPDVFDIMADVTGAILAQEILRAWFRRRPEKHLAQRDET